MVTPASQQFTVLVIDDDRLIRELVADCLEAIGYSILVAASGREGIELAKAHRPHLILIDYHMPEMDGEETVRALKLEPGVRAIPCGTHIGQQHRRQTSK